MKQDTKKKVVNLDKFGKSIKQTKNSKVEDDSYTINNILANESKNPRK